MDSLFVVITILRHKDGHKNRPCRSFSCKLWGNILENYPLRRFLCFSSLEFTIKDDLADQFVVTSILNVPPESNWFLLPYTIFKIVRSYQKLSIAAISGLELHNPHSLDRDLFDYHLCLKSHAKWFLKDVLVFLLTVEQQHIFSFSCKTHSM